MLLWGVSHNLRYDYDAHLGVILMHTPGYSDVHLGGSHCAPRVILMHMSEDFQMHMLGILMHKPGEFDVNTLGFQCRFQEF